MKLTLERYLMGEKSTLGKLYVNDEFQCYTLEDKDRNLEDGGEKVKGKTCIPRGTYRVILDFSNRFGRVLPHILDVPPFVGIRIHPGNTSEDTEGCILVGGKPTGDDFIPNSRRTFDVLFEMMEQAEQERGLIEIEVK